MKYAYESKPVSEVTAESINQIRTAFSDLEDFLVAKPLNDDGTVTQNARYLALVKTHLETACMFAIKSLTHPDVK